MKSSNNDDPTLPLPYGFINELLEAVSEPVRSHLLQSLYDCPDDTPIQQQYLSLQHKRLPSGDIKTSPTAVGELKKFIFSNINSLSNNPTPHDHLSQSRVLSPVLIFSLLTSGYLDNIESLSLKFTKPELLQDTGIVELYEKVSLSLRKMTHLKSLKLTTMTFAFKAPLTALFPAGFVLPNLTHLDLSTNDLTVNDLLHLATARPSFPSLEAICLMSNKVLGEPDGMTHLLNWLYPSLPLDSLLVSSDGDQKTICTQSTSTQSTISTPFPQHIQPQLLPSPSMPNLISLDLSHCYIKAVTIPILAASPILAQISSLDISYTSSLTTRGFLTLLGSKYFSANGNITKLIFKGTIDSTMNPLLIVKKLSSLPGLANLTSLVLENTRMTDDAIRFIAESPHLKKIEVFSLNNNGSGNITDLTLKLITTSPNFTNLKHLDLCYCKKITPRGLGYLASRGSFVKKLECLKFTGQDFGDSKVSNNKDHNNKNESANDNKSQNAMNDNKNQNAMNDNNITNNNNDNVDINTNINNNINNDMGDFNNSYDDYFHRFISSSNIQNLTHLTLRETKLSISSLFALATSNPLVNLVHLDICMNPVGLDGQGDNYDDYIMSNEDDDVVENTTLHNHTITYTKPLFSNPTFSKIKTLYLFKCNLNDSDMGYLGASVYMKGLERLFLSSNGQISDRGIALLLGLKKNTSNSNANNSLYNNRIDHNNDENICDSNNCLDRRQHFNDNDPFPHLEQFEIHQMNQLTIQTLRHLASLPLFISHLTHFSIWDSFSTPSNAHILKDTGVFTGWEVIK